MTLPQISFLRLAVDDEIPIPLASAAKGVRDSALDSLGQLVTLASRALLATAGAANPGGIADFAEADMTTVARIGSREVLALVVAAANPGMAANFAETDVVAAARMATLQMFAVVDTAANSGRTASSAEAAGEVLAVDASLTNFGRAGNSAEADAVAVARLANQVLKANQIAELTTLASVAAAGARVMPSLSC